MQLVHDRFGVLVGVRRGGKASFRDSTLSWIALAFPSDVSVVDSRDSRRFRGAYRSFATVTLKITHGKNSKHSAKKSSNLHLMDEDSGSIRAEPVYESERRRLRKQERWMEAKKRPKETPKGRKKGLQYETNVRRKTMPSGSSLHQTNKRMNEEKVSSASHLRLGIELDG